MVLRSRAYTEATPARISSSVRNAFSGVRASDGTSVRSVQPSSSTGTRSARRLARRTFVLLRNVFISVVAYGWAFVSVRALEEDPGAGRERARARVRQVVEAARGEAGIHEHLGIVPRVVGHQEQVVAGDVDARPAAEVQALRQVERVADRHVLQA